MTMATWYGFVVNLLLLLVMSRQALAWQNADSTSHISLTHTDFIYTDNKKIYQDIYIKSETDKKVNLNLICYRYGNNGDSSLIFRRAHSMRIPS
jgi:hypothetical protein